MNTSIHFKVYKHRPKLLKDEKCDGLYQGACFNGDIPELLGVITIFEPIGAGYVAHEIMHAILDYMEMADIKPDCNNETLVYAVGELHREFWDWYLR